MSREVILMVGSMGSGKTTYCKKNFSNYTRISQDEMGKKAHMQEYIKALKNKENIVIDRINHIRSQRTKYLDLAREHNYKTKIVVHNEPFSTCYKRIFSREGHPNLHKNSDEKDILSALRMYNKEYEYPLEEEADKVEFVTKYDPFILDLSNKYENYIIIGDIHGCFDELKELYDTKLKKIHDKNTAIIFIGDIMDKGPKVKESWEFFKSLQRAYCIKGNHEYKVIRYLRGNNVSITYGLDKTLEAFNIENSIKTKEAKELLLDLEDLPLAVKISHNNYIVHAGLNPLYSIEEQQKQYLLFTRTFNPTTENFKDGNDEYWFEYYSEDRPTIYFGHHYHKDIQVKPNVYALDGYCVYGEELRAIYLEKSKEGFTKQIFTLQAKKTYFESKHFGNLKSLEPFERLHHEGYLKKVENKDLVLYNYTTKCIYEKNWNDYTKIARGIIFEKATGEVIARPFEKFFNVGEVEKTQEHKLPTNFDHWIYDKIDGTLGIIYFYDGKWRVATRGALNSEQSQKAQELLETKYLTKPLRKGKTYMVEIIYPENKHVIDYKDKEELILLAVRDNKLGKEVPYDILKKVSKETKIPLVKRYNSLTLKQALEKKKELNENQEGYVVYFANDLRVKIKGDEYLNIAKLKTDFSAQKLWNVMDKGKIPQKYMQKIEEEFIDKAEEIKKNLENKYLTIEKEIEKDIEILTTYIDKPLHNIEKKEFALALDKYRKKLEHPQILFSVIEKNKNKIEDYIKEKIKPLS